MTPWKRAGFLSLTLIVALCWVASLSAKKGRALTVDEISTAWIGISEDELTLVRIIFASDGTGKGAYVYRGQTPVTFSVLDWSYEKHFKMTIRLDEEIDDFSESVAGELVGARMSLQFSGEDWTMTVSMRMESALLSDWVGVASATGFPFPIESETQEQSNR